jgi:hypothetical protein
VAAAAETPRSQAARSGRAGSSPLEVKLGEVARAITKDPVAVQCNTASEWSALAAAGGFDASRTPAFSSWTNGIPTGRIDIAPQACTVLSGFYAAKNKARMSVACRTGTKLVVKAGKRRRVPVYGECRTYVALVTGITRISREIAHQNGGRGYDDPQVIECYGMQYSAYALRVLGAEPPLTRRITTDYWKRVYNVTVRHTDDWSPDCANDGDLDLFPDSDVWPAGPNGT